MTSRLRTLFGGAAMLLAFALGTASVATAQTITVSGCASFTTVAQTGTQNIQITCNSTGGGGPNPPVCSGATITPVGGSPPTSLSFSATCTAGTNPMTSVVANGTTMCSGAQCTSPYSVNVTGIAVPTVQTNYVVTASDGQGGIGSASASYSPGGGTQIDVSGCTALGFNGRGVDVPYPTVGNLNIDFIFSTATPTGGAFTNSSALVVRFQTPALGVNDSSLVNFAAEPGSNGNRQATLSTAPCQIPTYNQTTAPVIKTMISQTPGFTIAVAPSGVCNIVSFLCASYTWLAPSTYYYITLVNKGPTFTSPANTCTSGNCDMRLNWNN